MKKLNCLILIFIMVFSLAGCDKYESFYYSLDRAEEFYEILKTENKTFYNVTPEGLNEENNLQIFKNNENGESFILMDAETYKICDGGSFGFISAAFCDYDENGKNDLLISFNDNEGAKLVIFDAKNKAFKGETIIDDDSSFIINKTKKITVGESLFDVSVEGFTYNVIEIEVKSSKNFAKLKYQIEERVGEAQITPKGPVFKEAE